MLRGLEHRCARPRPQTWQRWCNVGSIAVTRRSCGFAEARQVGQPTWHVSASASRTCSTEKPAGGQLLSSDRYARTAFPGLTSRQRSRHRVQLNNSPRRTAPTADGGSGWLPRLWKPRRWPYDDHRRSLRGLQPHDPETNQSPKASLCRPREHRAAVPALGRPRSKGAREGACPMSMCEERAVVFLPLLEIPGDGLVAVCEEFEIEREACDKAEQLARSGYGRYAGAVPAVSHVWLATGGEDGGAL